ncbi:hypothetical protein OOZ51_03485 [Arthrobacter sp. MI7-26]|uniref:hypothetical protein n=1 Tax=Arthrobacter sp. MI7-26 TaxID=2993653 RepID=UPI002248DFF6|nr:hypothetical protein [Arthrobacter sp. MI7-26]MCX2746875.1 hypothetical protein [Arthrobacter sp. MI7-26]
MPDGSKAYVTNWIGGSVSVIDVASGTVISNWAWGPLIRRRLGLRSPPVNEAATAEWLDRRNCHNHLPDQTGTVV